MCNKFDINSFNYVYTSKDLFPKTSGVYALVFSEEPSVVYVGSACGVCGFYGRWLVHLSQLRNNLHSNSLISKAYSRYGEESIRFVILEVTEKDQAVSRESYWIGFFDSFENGMNLTLHANSLLGFRHSDDTRVKISKSKFEKLVDNYENIVCELYVIYGLTVKEIADKLAISKKPISKILKFNGINTYENKNSQVNKKEVYQYDLSGRFIKKYNSIYEASTDLKIGYGKILNVVRGVSKRAGNFLWSYTYIGDSDLVLDKTQMVARKKSTISINLKNSMRERAKVQRNAVKYRNIKQIDASGNIVNVWSDTSQIMQHFNCKRSCIIRVLTGNRSKFKGFMWTL